MTMVGRPPKPTRLKVLAGNPGCRPLNLNEPKPQIATSYCPRWLKGEARKTWQRLAPELGRLGLLTVVDRDALEAYCQSYARWRAAERIIEEKGFIFKTAKGNIQMRPELSISLKERLVMLRFASEFGMTPSSRSRLSAAKNEDTGDELDAILRQSS